MGITSKQSIVIGNNIKAARNVRGFTQRALAEKLGIAFQNLSVWENGKGAPSAGYLIKLSTVLSVSLEQLTSPDGIAANLQGAILPQSDSISEDTSDGSDQLMLNLEEMLSQSINQELAVNNTLRRIVSSCEEILHLCKESR